MNIYIITILIISIFTISIFFSSCILSKYKLDQAIINKNIIILLSIFSSIFYFFIGNFIDLDKKYSQNQILMDEKSYKVRPLIIRLKKQQIDMRIYLSEFPNDHIIWSNLGQSYFMVQNFMQSKFAFSQALKLKPNNNVYLMNLITSNANMSNGNLKNKDEFLLYKFALNNIKNTHALNLIALNLYQKHFFVNSLIFWQQILINLEKDNISSFRVNSKFKSIKNNIRSILFNIDKRRRLESILDISNY